MRSPALEIPGPVGTIHTGRLVKNLQSVRRKIGNRRLMAVVKAGGYGHGAVAIARTLQEQGVDCLGVFTAAEARELRQAGIRGEIFIFGRMSADMLPVAGDLDLTLNIAWRDDVTMLRAYVRRTGRCPRVHLKIDTGMTRLGVPLEEGIPLLQDLAGDPHIRLEGVYTHFASADEADLSYARRQLERFQSVVAVLPSLRRPIPYVHAANSAAVLTLPEAGFTMVRVGILLYGAYPSEAVPRDLDLQPVMEFRAPIVTVRPVRAGTPVSYGSVYAPESDTTIGVIQCGFADGFPRPWYTHGYVIWKNRKYRIAGRICMDQFMVNFEGAQPAIGDQVLLFGEGSGDVLPVDEIGRTIGATPYQLFTAIGGRTRRIVFSG